MYKSNMADTSLSHIHHVDPSRGMLVPQDACPAVGAIMSAGFRLD